MSEWFKELVLKTSGAANVRGFESHSGRHVCHDIKALKAAFPAFLEMHENTKHRLQAVGSSLPASIGF